MQTETEKCKLIRKQVKDSYIEHKRVKFPLKITLQLNSTVRSLQKREYT